MLRETVGLAPVSARILRELTMRAETSQTDLQQLLGASAPTVFRAVEQLKGLGLVRERGLIKRGNGRPAGRLELEPSGLCALALVVQADVSYMSLVGVSGTVQEQRTLAVTSADSYEAALNTYIDAANDMSRIAARKFSALAGLGISFSGSVNSFKGYIGHPSRFPNWHDRPLVRDLEDGLSIPCSLENDATALVSALLWFSGEHVPDDFMLLNVDHGLGVGFSFDSRPYLGQGHVPRGLAHTTGFSPIDAVCHCGQTGCLELRLSIPGVINRGREQLLISTSHDIGWTQDLAHLEQIADENVKAANLLEETGALAADVAGTIGGALDLPAIVFAGRLLEASNRTWAATERRLLVRRSSGYNPASWWRSYELLPNMHPEALAATAVSLYDASQRRRVVTLAPDSHRATR